MNAEDLKLIVKEKYGEIASQDKMQNATSCCGSTNCCDDVDYTIFSDDYSTLKGYNSDADLGLGCGLPTEYAGIKTGDSILDLGSGAGNDCFVARSLTGETGRVVGLDFTEEMLEKARQNNKKLAFENVEFVKGDIEEIPLDENTFDVVISNCVLNLVPDKVKAFAGIYKVLKKGAHFCVSDVVLKGVLPEGLKNDAAMYAGCVSGAIQMDDYIQIIEQAGFSDVKVRKEKIVEIPEEILKNYLSEAELNNFKEQKIGILSVTVTGEK